jgi:hypothetical protein
MAVWKPGLMAFDRGLISLPWTFQPAIWFHRGGLWANRLSAFHSPVTAAGLPKVSCANTPAGFACARASRRKSDVQQT